MEHSRKHKNIKTYDIQHSICKKKNRLFCPKKHYMIHFFIIAMDDWWFVIVCCLIEGCSAKDRRAKHSQYHHDYHRSLDKFHRRLRQRKIPRCSLLEQSQSAWRRLYKSRNDEGMITLTSFDRATFDSYVRYLHPPLNRTHLLFPLVYCALNVRKSKIGEGLRRFGQKTA